MASGAAWPGPSGYPRPRVLRDCQWPVSPGPAGRSRRALFSFDHEHRLNVLGECLGLPPGRVDEPLWQSGFNASCDAGRYRDAAAVRAHVRRITDYADPDKRLDAAWCSAFRPDPDVIELLARRPGGRRGVFTNNGPLEEELLTGLYPEAFGPFRALVLLLASYREQT